ncbi:MAG: peptide ABC transporter substrate-binding protein [Candidatus Harrisonbacteria bacterium]|nr:peptide ABC transporter substrate-binding protein [Candidatus Harrisonbacteria bacterium]
MLFSGLALLSENIAPSENGRVFTVTLKKDLRWSDGEPLTTDDILFTLETIQDIAARSPLFPTWQGVVAERLSEREMKFTLKTPYAFFADNLRDLRVIPRHIFGAIPSLNLRLSAYNLQPIGSGPYAFSNFEKRKDGFITDYVLTANPYFASTTPYLTEFRFKFFSSPAEVLGAFNRFAVTGFGGFNARDLNALTVGDDAHYLEVPRYYAVFINQGLHPALKEREVREALARATDRARIVATVFGGAHRASAAFGPIAPTIEGYDESVYADDRFSTTTAAALLEKAGWKPGSDGVRAKNFGRSPVRLAFDMVVPEIPFLVQAAELIKAQWADIGVSVTPLLANPADINASVLKTRNYQLLLFGNILNGNPDVFAFWHSSERFSPGFNLAVYESKPVDALLESIRKDFAPSSRAKTIRKLQELLLNDRPAIFLFNPSYLYVTSKQLKGFSAANIVTPANRFDDVTSWYFRTKRVWKTGV